MRRRDMLKHIEECLFKAGYYIDSDMAEVFLRAVESKGMVPPETKFKEEREDYNNYDESTGYMNSLYTVEYSKNEWEDN